MNLQTRVKAPLFSSLHRLLFGVLLGLFAASCTLLEETGPSTSPGLDGDEGVVDLRVQLALARNFSNLNALEKSASADTTFDLDSLIIVLSANGAATQTHTYPMTGRADLGNIAVSPKTFVLSSLRLWKAKFISIDTTGNPVRRDTVHMDSVFFNVTSAETTFVAKTVNPVWSILRVRFRSALADSLVNSVKFLRLRVNGVVRDSMILGAKNASLNWLQALPGSTIHAAGDSGRVLRSTNDGSAWDEQVLTTQPFVAGNFFSSTQGSVVSSSGKVFTTSDGGLNWQERHNAPDSVNAMMFSQADHLWAVGRNGGIHKSEGAGWGWWTLVSNTTHKLNGISFPTPSVAFVVGENETILKTSNATAAPGSAPQNGGVIWAPVAGGWFPQTSNDTKNLTAIQFTSTTNGWTLGHGYAYRTVDGGATWLDRSSGISGANINAMSFLSGTLAFAAGAGGAILKMDGNEWSWPAMTNASNTINGRDLHDIEMVNVDTGYAVGAGGALLTTFNASQAAHQILWTSQRGWFPQVGFFTYRDIHAIRFAGAGDSGWAAGTNGEMFRTTNRGGTWTTQGSLTSYTLQDMFVHTGRLAVAVGGWGQVRRTVDGVNWTTINTGITNDLNATTFASRQVGWFVGAGNTIRSTNDSGKTWTARTGTGTHYGIGLSTTKVFVVGASGKVMRSTNRNHNTTFTATGNSGMAAFQLNAIDLVGNDTAWVVGNGGKIFRSVNANTATATNVTWASQTSGTTENLTHVHFVDRFTGYVSGANGIVLKTTNGGTNWSALSTGTTNALNDLYLVDANTVYAAGASGKIIKTADGGVVDTTTYRSLAAVTSKLVFAVGSVGKIMRTTNAGESWTPLTSNTTQGLNGVTFRNASIGYAVGKGGVILKTVNGGGAWTALTSGTTTELTSIKFVSADTGYAVGKTGVVVKTVNGGTSWYTQETPTTVTLNRVHGFSKDMVFAVGANGTILKAVNEGDNWTGGGVKRSLKAVSFPSSTVGYIVGAEGFILKTTNGGDFWKIQTSGTTQTLYSVNFTHVDTGYAVGDAGVILKTVNGGTNWVSQSGGSSIALRWTHARNGKRAFAIGGTQTLLSTSNGGSTAWTGSFVGVPGARLFDELLTFKYFKPNQSHTVLLEAIDRMELPLRGYQATRTVTVGAGVDSVMVSPMARCGYGTPVPNCVP